jgi:argininosuccinate lyase
LEVAATVLRNIRVNAEVARNAAAHGYLNATELADYLVRQGMPFREAHETVGRIVLLAMERGVELQELSLAELQQFSKLIGAEVFATLTLEQTLATKDQIGGTSPRRVAEALAQAHTILD